ncbi:DUF397 domain-containing protein [Streptomyces sp. NPDC002787]
MPDYQWRKSSFSPDGSNCVNVAANPTSGAIHLRESDNPATILTTTRAPLRSLIHTLKGAEAKNGQLDASPT